MFPSYHHYNPIRNGLSCKDPADVIFIQIFTFIFGIMFFIFGLLIWLKTPTDLRYLGLTLFIIGLLSIVVNASIYLIRLRKSRQINTTDNPNTPILTNHYVADSADFISENENAF